jgi:rhamnogalacturonyl hydrolase YesR
LFYSSANPKTYQPGREFNYVQEYGLNSYSLSEAAKRIVNQVITENRTYPNINPYTTHQYTLDLTLEALIHLSDVTQKREWREYAISVTKTGGFTSYSPIPYQRQPFASINYALYNATGDNNWLPIFIRESVFLRDESKRSPEGAVLYYSRAEKGTHALLIDFIQEYCARMARCGKITWDDSFFSECVSQFQIYRSILRDHQSGLWSQGKGWSIEEPDRLSPGAWSRGHGWLLRGLTESLANMPRDSREFKELQNILKELVEALLPLQDKNGRWHALLNLKTTRSEEHTSELQSDVCSSDLFHRSSPP